MTFDEWWRIKSIEKADIPKILSMALKELAYEAWCESRYHQSLIPGQLDICKNCAAKKLFDESLK